ncbi:hypothetical protein B0H10DRAFT_982628 [Mycena sp. CBHHK59/15]|nr:hypothetical protein B0H10DRAFT_982628 [Mycena sp. CBHHK59/15]
MAYYHPQRQQTFSPEEGVQNFVPGVFRFPPPAPTPESILSGTYRPQDVECIEFFPRRSQYCERPSYTITFSVRGHRAPYLREILKDRVLLDGAHDMVMAFTGWSRTKWVIDWPGHLDDPRGLWLGELTRVALAKEVGMHIGQFMKNAELVPPPLGEHSPWATHSVRFADIRLVALNYYKRVWVPVLALDL